jgi:hypothetical protein
LGGVALEVYWFLTQPETFVNFQATLPERIVVIESETAAVLLPREVLMYGVPLALLSLAGRLGLEMLGWGVAFIEPDRKRPRP